MAGFAAIGRKPFHAQFESDPGAGSRPAPLIRSGILPTTWWSIVPPVSAANRFIDGLMIDSQDSTAPAAV